MYLNRKYAIVTYLSLSSLEYAVKTTVVSGIGSLRHTEHFVARLMCQLRESEVASERTSSDHFEEIHFK